jgi:isopenicillin N synthase-like dioxygenase
MTNDTNETIITSIDYSDLISESSSNSDSLLQKIGKGFGNSDESLGIIAITNIPNYSDLRSKLLRLSHQLATCTPKTVLDKLTIPSANYQVGWSHGQERVEGKNKFDTAKGSYYANPLSDDVLEYVLERDFPSEDEDDNDDKNETIQTRSEKKREYIRIAKENPAFYASNVWPETLPALESNFKEMGLLIRSIGQMVAKICDTYVSTKCQEYEPRKIEDVIAKSMCCKGRLLHYFPMATQSSSADDSHRNSSNDADCSSWCGWHNDHVSKKLLEKRTNIKARSYNNHFQT